VAVSAWLIIESGDISAVAIIVELVWCDGVVFGLLGARRSLAMFNLARYPTRTGQGYGCWLNLCNLGWSSRAAISFATAVEVALMRILLGTGGCWYLLCLLLSLSSVYRSFGWAY